MEWANNRIRVQYKGSIGRLFSGVTWNSTEVPEDFDMLKDFDKDIKGVNQVYNISFERKSYMKNGFKFTHSEDLHDMYAMFMIFSTQLWRNETLYSNWDFKTPEDFDNFWFDSNNTQFIYHALNYWIGKD